MFFYRLLGGSWVVLSRVINKSPNMGYKYSYPTYSPTYQLPMNLNQVPTLSGLKLLVLLKVVSKGFRASISSLSRHSTC